MNKGKECIESYDLMKYSFIKRVKYSVIKKLLKNHNLGVVLDIGSGGGFFSEKLSRKAKKIVSIDILYDNIKETAENIKSDKICFAVADATKLPFKDKSFNTIIAADVIEHIERDDLVISEIDRLLSDNGKCVITSVCTNPSINLKFLRKLVGYDMASAWGHVREGYNKKDFQRILNGTGLRLRKVKYSLPFFGELMANFTILLRKRKSPETWESGNDLGSVKKSWMFKIYKILFPLFYGIVLLDKLLFFLKGNKIEVMLTR